MRYTPAIALALSLGVLTGCSMDGLMSPGTQQKINQLLAPYGFSLKTVDPSTGEARTYGKNDIQSVTDSSGNAIPYDVDNSGQLTFRPTQEGAQTVTIKLKDGNFTQVNLTGKAGDQKQTGDIAFIPDGSGQFYKPQVSIGAPIDPVAVRNATLQQALSAHAVTFTFGEDGLPGLTADSILDVYLDRQRAPKGTFKVDAQGHLLMDPSVFFIAQQYAADNNGQLPPLRVVFKGSSAPKVKVATCTMHALPELPSVALPGRPDGIGTAQPAVGVGSGAGVSYPGMPTTPNTAPPESASPTNGGGAPGQWGYGTGAPNQSSAGGGQSTPGYPGSGGGTTGMPGFGIMIPGMPMGAAPANPSNVIDLGPGGVPQIGKGMGAPTTGVGTAIGGVGVAAGGVIVGGVAVQPPTLDAFTAQTLDLAVLLVDDYDTMDAAIAQFHLQLDVPKPGETPPPPIEANQTAINQRVLAYAVKWQLGAEQVPGDKLRVFTIARMARPLTDLVGETEQGDALMDPTSVFAMQLYQKRNNAFPWVRIGYEPTPNTFKVVRFRLTSAPDWWSLWNPQGDEPRMPKIDILGTDKAVTSDQLEIHLDTPADFKTYFLNLMSSTDPNP